MIRLSLYLTFRAVTHCGHSTGGVFENSDSLLRNFYVRGHTDVGMPDTKSFSCLTLQSHPTITYKWYILLSLNPDEGYRPLRMIGYACKIG